MDPGTGMALAVCFLPRWLLPCRHRRHHAGGAQSGCGIVDGACGGRMLIAEGDYYYLLLAWEQERLLVAIPGRVNESVIC